MIVIPSRFEGLGRIGDFNFMIKSGQFPRALFIFNDNEEEHFTSKKGGGNAVIRPFNRHGAPSHPQSAGIPTGKRWGGGGYQSLTPQVLKEIDNAIAEIRELLATGNYDTIYFSSDDNGILGISIFNVHLSVRQYITDQILALIY